MSNYYNTSHNEVSPELQGSILWGILGGVAGMIVCILVMLLCSLFQMSSFSTMLQLFVGLVIGWFYRLFHGRRSKTAAYVTVGSCTISASVLWVVLLALLSVLVSPVPFTTADWGRLWGEIWELLLLCAGLGMIGFFLTRKSLLAYADWKRGPWYVAYAGGNGCNVLYDKNYQVLAKFAGSMKHADLMFLWLLQREISIVGVPAGWYSPDKDNPEPEPVKSSVLRRQFVLCMKRSTGIGFAVIGCFMLLLGLALFLAVFLLTDVSALPMVDRCALVFLELAEMGMGIVSLRIGKVSRVEVDGEQMRVVSRFGRAAEFSVRDVSSVSRSLGWIVLYDREFKTLAKVDSYLEDMERLKEYMASYGIKM